MCVYVCMYGGCKNIKIETDSSITTHARALLTGGRSHCLLSTGYHGLSALVAGDCRRDDLMTAGGFVTTYVAGTYSMHLIAFSLRKYVVDSTGGGLCSVF